MKKVLLIIFVFAFIILFCYKKENEARILNNESAIRNAYMDNDEENRQISYGVEENVENDILEFAKQAFQSVLLNETVFSCTDGRPYDNTNVIQQYNGFLKDIPYGYQGMTNIDKFAVIDFDGDAIPEVILEIEEYYGFVILRYKEGQILGNVVGYKGMSPLRANGAFENGNGAFDITVEKLYFIGDTFIGDSKMHKIMALNHVDYYIDDILVDKEKYERAYAGYEEIPEVEWHTYTDEAISEFIGENPLFAVNDIEKNVEERQDYLDSLAYLIELTYDSGRKDKKEFSTDAKIYYDGCCSELDKIYLLCEEKLSDEDFANLALEQDYWEDNNVERLKKDLQNYHVDSIEDLEDKALYYTYGDIILRRVLKLIDLYYGITFYNWVS